MDDVAKQEKCAIYTDMTEINYMEDVLQYAVCNRINCDTVAFNRVFKL